MQRQQLLQQKTRYVSVQFSILQYNLIQIVSLSYAEVLIQLEDNNFFSLATIEGDAETRADTAQAAEDNVGARRAKAKEAQNLIDVGLSKADKEDLELEPNSLSRLARRRLYALLGKLGLSKEDPSIDIEHVAARVTIVLRCAPATTPTTPAHYQPKDYKLYKGLRNLIAFQIGLKLDPYSSL